MCLRGFCVVCWGEGGGRAVKVKAKAKAEMEGEAEAEAEGEAEEWKVFGDVPGAVRVWSLLWLMVLDLRDGAIGDFCVLTKKEKKIYIYI